MVIPHVGFLGIILSEVSPLKKNLTSCGLFVNSCVEIFHKWSVNVTREKSVR